MFPKLIEQSMKKLFIETYGCQMNVADSEVVASVMGMAGYELCESVEDADAVFLNTCSVRENAENKVLHRLETLHNIYRNKGRKVILGVLGCMAERMKEELLEKHHASLVAGPDSYLALPDLIAQCELGQKAIDTELSLTETYKGHPSTAHPRTAVVRIREHHARMQQLLPLLHRPLHPRP